MKDKEISDISEKVTIGITGYNSGSLLQKAIDSVINQSSNSWEAILILDGGSDKISKKIFDSLNHPKFIKYKFESNQGPYFTRSKAIDLSKNKWYLHLDGDDLLPNNTVKIILETIKKNHDAEFIYGNCLYFNDKYLELRKPNQSIDALAYGPLFQGVSPIKISLFRRLGGFCKDLYINADWDFWISVYENNIKGYYVDKTIYERRYRKNNVGSEFSHLKLQIIKLIIKRHPKFFANEKRKRLVWFNYYEKLARRNKSLGKRIKAYEYAKKAMEYGEEIPVFKTIFQEQKMSVLRYAFRRLGRVL